MNATKTERRKFGEAREDGYLFRQYSLRNGRTIEVWVNPESFRRSVESSRKRHEINKVSINAKHMEWYRANKDKALERMRLNYAKNKERHRAASKIWREKNREKKMAMDAAWRLSNKDRISKNCREWRIKNRDRYNASARALQKRQWDSSPAFAIAKRMRSRLWKIVSEGRKNGAITAHTIDLLGCSVKELLNHLEAQFTDGMNWGNRSEWHIDHIIPFAAIDPLDVEQLKKVCHFSNLRPMWAKDNIAKGAKI